MNLTDLSKQYTALEQLLVDRVKEWNSIAAKHDSSMGVHFDYIVEIRSDSVVVLDDYHGTRTVIESRYLGPDYRQHMDRDAPRYARILKARQAKHDRILSKWRLVMSIKRWQSG